MIWRLLDAVRRRLWRWRAGGGDLVSEARLLEIRRDHWRAGVDLPTWRTPAEIKRMRRQQLRLVKKTGTNG